MYTLAPFFRYCSATLASPSLKMTTRCHSVFSLRSPVALSRQVSEVATLKLAIGRPSWVRRISGSLPRFPTRITLFTLPAIAALQTRNDFPATRSIVTRPESRAGPPPPLQQNPIPRPPALAGPSCAYPHIASRAPSFQFCSMQPHRDVQATGGWRYGHAARRQRSSPYAS